MKHNRLNKTAIIIVLMLTSISLSAQENSAYKEGNYIGENGDTLLYRVLWPKQFQKGKRYPVILFLHGSGERGEDNRKQLTHGSKLFLDNQEKFPAIVIFPQCPTQGYWSNVDIKIDSSGHKNFTYKKGGAPTPSMQLVMNMMDSVAQLSFVDTSRIYVMGLSMGGMGTFEIISRKPDMFAAAIPICGGAHPKTAKNFANKVNLWVFHGAKDNVVSPEFSKAMVEVIKKLNGSVKYTVFPDANHNSWDSTFAEPQLLPWLFSNTK